MNKTPKYKIILTLLLIVTLVCQFGIIGYASDSEEISGTEYDEKNSDEYDSIWDPSRYEIMWNINLYYDYFMDKFAKQENIPDMLSKQERWTLIIDHLQESTMIVDQSYLEHSGGGAGVGTINEEKWRILIRYMEFPELLFGDAIVVRSCYCLHGTAGYMGLDDKYVYYETDIGDYVLYCHSNEIEHLYLVPLPAMQKYAKSVISHMTETQSLWGYYSQAVTNEDLKLIAHYEITSPDYDPSVPSDFYQSDIQTQTNTFVESSDMSSQLRFSDVLQNPYLYLFVLFALLIMGFNIWLFRKIKE